MYAFLVKLIQDGLYDGRVRISISLNNTADRRLGVLGPGRMPLFRDYRSYANVIEVPVRDAPPDEIVRDYADMALDAAAHIYGQFNWDAVPLANMREEQSKLIARGM